MDRVWDAIQLCDASDDVGALEIWRDLVEQGSVWSMIEIGRCYEYGRGVARDATEAENWYYRAFVGGSQVAMLKCAKAAAARRDFNWCDQILRRGVDQGWAPAMFWSAWYRYQQSRSVKADLGVRILLEKAAKSGHPAALMILAKLMVQGRFGFYRIPRGFKLAMEWARSVNPQDENGASRLPAANDEFSSATSA